MSIGRSVEGIRDNGRSSNSGSEESGRDINSGDERIVCLLRL